MEEQREPPERDAAAADGKSPAAAAPPVSPPALDPVPAQAPETAPDPEEDDLDDLDDILDEFSATKIAEEEVPATAQPAAPAGSGKAPEPDAALTDADLAAQLQAGMANLIGELDAPEMKQQFEALVKDMGSALSAGLPSSQPTEPSPKGAPPSASATEEPFQETIRRTMERMQDSDQQTSAAATSDEPSDMFAELLKEIQAGGLGDDSMPPGGSDEDFSTILLRMMEQLTSREILFEPMQELHKKYPAWLAAHAGTTPAADLARYEEQRRLVAEIVDWFKAEGYSDDKASDREFIVARMQKMQAAGSPPADLVGDLDAAQEALGDLNAGCPQQ